MVLYFQKKEVTINPSFDINIKDEMDDETKDIEFFPLKHSA